MKKYSLLTGLLLLGLLLAGCQSKGETAAPRNVTPIKSPSVYQPVANTTSPSSQSGSSTDKNPAKSYAWYFIPNNQHLAPAIDKDAVGLLAQNQAIYLLPNADKKIYLSFDCGYELGYTGSILDTLQRKQIKAAFFITGQYIKSQPDLVKRMQAEGHLVCNHTWNHPDLATVDQAKLQQELKSLEQAYEELTGVPLDKYVRPPMGSFSANSLKWAKDAGYTTVFWSMAWKDWDPKQQPGADFVYQYAMDHIHSGAIILMHAVSSSDTEALEKIINDLQAQGYAFSTFNN